MAHLMEIGVYMWQPLIVEHHALLALDLRLPCPIPVEVKVEVVDTSSWPGLIVLYIIDVWIIAQATIASYPMRIPIEAIRVN